MNSDYITQRHQQLWSDQNKQIQRTVAATLIFAIVALFNVLLPYQNNYVEKAEITAQIDSLKTLSTQSRLLLNETDKLDDVLMDVAKVIDTKPWDQKRIDLMNAYARNRDSVDMTTTRQQELADNTVRDIAALVRRTVYNPLANFLKNDSLAAQHMPATLGTLKELPQLLDNWVNENINKRWYETRSEKEATVNRLTTSLDAHLNSLSHNLQMEKDALLEHKNKIAQDIALLQSQNKVKQKEEKLKEIEAQMAEIIPSWLKGLVSVKQLVEYFPLIIAILFIYIFLLAHSLSKHYAVFAQSDPSTFKGNALVASVWTMTDRGRSTILTAAAYILLAVILWFFFERGLFILHYCLDVDPNFNKGLENYMFLSWFVRIAMLSTAVYAFIAFWENMKKSG